MQIRAERTRKGIVAFDLHVFEAGIASCNLALVPADLRKEPLPFVGGNDIGSIVNIQNRLVLIINFLKA